MYCSNCGTKAQGNFCSQCGNPLQSANRLEAIEALEQACRPEPPHWENDTLFENIVQVDAIRNAIALNAINAVKGVSAEAIFALYDKIIASPIPLERLAAVIQPLYDSWGIRTGKEHIEVLAVPIGRAIAQTLCSFAKNGQAFQNATQIENGCLLIAELPSSLCSLTGKLQVRLLRQDNSTLVEASTIIPGQAFDWGKSTRCLELFFSDQKSDLGLPMYSQKAA